MKRVSILKKVITTILSLTILLSISLTVLASDNRQEPITYEYYGIVSGDGQQTNIYLKVNDTWQLYTMKSNYIGIECKCIVIDRELTTDNYKDIQIINIKDITNVIQANECINEWNSIREF